MILTHGANSLARGVDFVEIGGRKYKTVKIGSQIWMAENLDYKPTGVTVGTNAWYYNNDEENYGIDGTYKCGLLYNWYAAKYLDDNKATLLPNGWHVPSRTEFDTLATAVGGNSVAGTKLKALDNSIATGFPSGWNGTDEYGFNGLPAGDRLDSFSDIGTYCNFWSNYEYSNTHGYNNYITSASTLQEGQVIKQYAISIRLVRDAT